MCDRNTHGRLRTGDQRGTIKGHEISFRGDGYTILISLYSLPMYINYTYLNNTINSV